ncbi:MAG: hypothetical protein HY420_00650 [Candidatus Kerfeldbacteria bacterium]|nr:hypothetical protein [Candidatus Kerfeldbacteria bacterium]
MTRLPAAVSRPERPSFLNGAVQRALDLKLVTDDWLESYLKEAERRAENLAERNTKHRSPTEEEFRGAQIRIRQFLTFGVESRSRGDLEQAARCLATTPMTELLRAGKIEFDALRRAVRRVADQLRSHEGYGSQDLYRVDAELFLAETLEDLGRKTMDSEQMERIADRLWFGKLEIDLGMLLVEHFRSYHRKHLDATYPQLLHNLAVNVGLRRRPMLDINLRDVGTFLRRLFPDGQLDSNFADQLGVGLVEHLKQFGASEELCRWFRLRGWPGYVEQMREFAEVGQVNKRRCVSWRTFYPTGRRGVGTMVLTESQQTKHIFSQMRVNTVPEQLRRLRQFDTIDIEWYLSGFAQDDPGLAARLLDGIAPKQAMEILRFHEVYLVDFEIPDPTVPAWIQQYLNDLRKNARRKNRLKTVFRKTKKPDIVPRS